MMKTTVSAAILLLLATYECSAQQFFWSPKLRLQPVWSFQDQQGSGLQQQPQYAQENSGGFAQASPPQNPSLQNRGGPTNPQRNQPQNQWAQPVTATYPTGYQNNNHQSQGSQYQPSNSAAQGIQPLSNSNQNLGGQPITYAVAPGSQSPNNRPQASRNPSSGSAAAGYGANSDLVTPSGGRQPPKNKGDGIWHTPDHSSSTYPPSRAPETSRPKTTSRPESPSETTTTKRWVPKRPALLAVADAAKKQSTSRPLKVVATPQPDKFVFPIPGAGSPESTFNSLDVADRPDEVTDNADAGPDSATNINNGLRQFALDMLMDMTGSTPNKNVVLSPYSIWAVMLVIYEGAEGQTAKQIASTLHFNHKKSKVRKNYKQLEYALQRANNESHSDFVSGNGIFYDGMRPPLPDFERFALSDYQCTLRPVDFSRPQTAVKVINDWVSEVTKDRIKMLVKLEDIVRPELIITNALFFKGQWKIPFNRTATHTDKFYNEKKQHISDVRMMYQKGPYMYSFITEIGAHVLDMPYEDSKFRMLVVLPKPSSTVAEVLRLMKKFPVDLCYDRLVHEQEMFADDEVHVYLPRFKFINRVELRPNLERLGITDVFDNIKANLSSMSPLNLFLGKVFHVSEIEVNEEGTIASAATAGSFVNKMGPPKFLANRPFAYFIVENSQKTVIFAGKLADPNQKAN